MAKLYKVGLSILFLISIGCTTRNVNSKPSASAEAASGGAFKIYNEDAVNMRRVVAKNCTDVPPFFQSLECLYNVDDDGNGNFMVSRSCECEVGGKTLKFKHSQDVLLISDIMENLHIGEHGPRQGHRIYKIVGMTCSGDDTANLVCVLRKP